MATTWKSSLKDSIYKPIYNKTTTTAKMKSEPEGKKRKKKRRRRKNPEKIKSTQAAANLRPREPGCLGRASPKSRAARGRATQAAQDLGLTQAWPRDPGRSTWATQPRPHGLRRAAQVPRTKPHGLRHAAQVVRPLIWSPSLWSGLPLSDLIWLFPPLWSNLIRWGEVALET